MYTKPSGGLRHGTVCLVYACHWLWSPLQKVSGKLVSQPLEPVSVQYSFEVGEGCRV